MFEKGFGGIYLDLGPEKMFEKNWQRNHFESKVQDVLTAKESTH
jgi:hypothetical protein